MLAMSETTHQDVAPDRARRLIKQGLGYKRGGALREGVEIITVAVRGGDDAPLAARDAWQEVLAAPADQILPRLADAIEAILARTAPVLAVAEAATAGSPELATQRERGQRNMRSDYREVADALARSGALADTVTPEYAADTIYALAGHDVYLRLTRECGWTGERYAAWLSDTLSAALNRAARRR